VKATSDTANRQTFEIDTADLPDDREAIFGRESLKKSVPDAPD
jgi:hypothetical protein